MKFSDETLMAYADGELDADTRRAIESAMATDAELARQVARHRTLRSELGAAFNGVLEEPVPGRLLEAANSSPTAVTNTVADLAAARARAQAPRRRWSWPEWTAIAASALIGILAGRSVLREPPPGLVATGGSGIVAAGALADALSDQLSGADAVRSAFDIGLSFRARSGEYCRTFASQERSAVAGFACREANEWRVHALAQIEPGARGGDYRMAGTPLPPSILAAIEDTIQGDALDAEQEAAARERGWRP